MTSFNKCVYDMLMRVLVFPTNYPHVLAENPLIAQLFGELERAAQKLSAHAVSQASGKGDVKMLTRERAEARDGLWSVLDTISRTAKGLKLAEFWLSKKDKSDQALIEAGQRFIDRVEPLRQRFIDSHLEAGFVETLIAAVQNFDKTMKARVFRENTRKAATTAIDDARTEALSILDRLDPLIENLLREDRPTLTVWQSARRIERYARSRRVTPNPSVEAPANPPVVIPNTAAAQA